jgi:dTDP-glucose 4,6-dehydratase
MSFARTVRRTTDVPDRPGHDRRYAMDITKIQTGLGWVPRHNLTSGLRATVEWYLDHPEWVAAISKQSGYNDWLDKNYGKRGEKV